MSDLADSAMEAAEQGHASKLSSIAAVMVALQRDVAPTLTKEARAALDARVADFKAKAARYDLEKGTIKAEAERLAKEYDTLNTHDDQFDMAEAALTVAIALYGIAILTQRGWMLGLACVFSASGFISGPSRVPEVEPPPRLAGEAAGLT